MHKGNKQTLKRLMLAPLASFGKFLTWLQTLQTQARKQKPIELTFFFLIKRERCDKGGSLLLLLEPTWETTYLCVLFSIILLELEVGMTLILPINLIRLTNERFLPLRSYHLSFFLLLYVDCPTHWFYPALKYSDSKLC